jgi:signal peptidase I
VRKKFDLAREMYEWADSLVFVFAAFVLVYVFIASVFHVNQDSMTNTLRDGERLIVSRLPYTPRHGDIILFTKYGWQSSFNTETGQYNPLVKRVVGLPGDTLEYRDGVLYRNGHRLNEDYVREAEWLWRGDMAAEVTVPEGSLFVLGDNRNNSRDSRSTDIGYVDTRSVLGRVVWRITPLNRFGTVG